jgi:hypothetical protein
VQEHLQHCIYCKRLLSEIESIVMAAQNLPALAVSDGFGKRVMEAINSRQETKEVLGAIRYRFTIAGVAFAVTSAAVFFLVGPPSTNVSTNYSGAQDSSMRLSPGLPDFYTHPETKVSSFPVPEGTISQQVSQESRVLSDSAIRIDEFVLPEIQQVRENVSGKF